MELTPLFNAAAGGDGGHAPMDTGPDVTGPGGGSASAALEQATSSAPEVTASPAYLPSKDFEYARAEVPTLAPACARDDMAVMIELLEKGRAKPGLYFNLRPMRALEKAVHKEVEFDREKLLAAFRAARPDLSDSHYELDEDVELFF